MLLPLLLRTICIQGMLSLTPEAYSLLEENHIGKMSQPRFLPMLVPPKLWQRHDRYVPSCRSFCRPLCRTFLLVLMLCEHVHVVCVIWCAVAIGHLRNVCVCVLVIALCACNLVHTGTVCLRMMKSQIKRKMLNSLHCCTHVCNAVLTMLLLQGCILYTEVQTDAY
jgi:hypothetical protein